MENCLVNLSGWIWVYQTKRRNRTPWTHSCFLNSDLCCVAIYVHLLSTLLNFQVKKMIWKVTNSCWQRTNMQEAFCPFYASFFYENILKQRVWSLTLWIEIYLVAYGFWHVVCGLSLTQWNRRVCFCHGQKMWCLFPWKKGEKG